MSGRYGVDWRVRRAYFEVRKSESPVFRREGESSYLPNELALTDRGDVGRSDHAAETGGLAARAIFALALVLVLILVSWPSLSVRAAEPASKSAASPSSSSGIQQTIESLQSVLAKTRAKLGPDHPFVANLLSFIGQLYAQEGDYRDAERNMADALTIREKALGPTDPLVAASLSQLAGVSAEMGNYSKAQRMYWQAIAIQEKRLGPNDPGLADTLDELASLLVKQRQYSQAERLYSRVIAIRKDRLKPNDPKLGESYFELGGLYVAQGEYAKAAPLMRHGAEILHAAMGTQGTKMAAEVGNLSRSLTHHDTHANSYSRDEVVMAKVVENDTRTLGPAAPQLASDLDILAGIYSADRNYERAETEYQRALAIREKDFGGNSLKVALTLEDMAATAAAGHQYADARRLFERARLILLAVWRSNEGLSSNELSGLVNAQGNLSEYLQLLEFIARTHPAATDFNSAPAAAFVVAEQMRNGVAQDALDEAAARVASGDPALSPLVRKTQDLKREQHALEGQLITEYERPAGTARARKILSLMHAHKRLEAELARINGRLRHAFPDYREVTSPAPIDTDGVSHLLEPGEVLISYYALPAHLLIWLVRPNGPLVYRDVPIGRNRLAAMVKRLRASLHPDAPYDVVDASALYNVLFGPFGRELSGARRLIIVPDKTTLPIPVAALLAGSSGKLFATLAREYRHNLAPSPVELRDDYPHLMWVVKESYAISVLPSATTLRELRMREGRQLATRTSQTGEPFIGIGAPSLKQPAVAPAGTKNPLARIITGLPPLPGARNELRTEAAVLGADPDHALFLGTQATKSVVMRLNGHRLARARVIAFATHALISRNLSPFAPALVLTPSPDGTPADGLLEIHDILQLKLGGNQWTILSACDTAAPGGSGQGFSGLVRAFFFAGAPSLLVSQWSVDDAATRQLMTSVLAAYAHDGLTRARALQDGMRMLMSDAGGVHAYFAHPFAWAPFFIVGEGGAPSEGRVKTVRGKARRPRRTTDISRTLKEGL